MLPRTQQTTQLIEIAESVARQRGHSVVTPLHIFAALFQVPESVPSAALASLGALLEHVYEDLPAKTRHSPVGVAMDASSHRLFDELAPAEAQARGARYLAPEHVLFALLSAPAIFDPRHLERAHTSAGALKDAIDAVLAGPVPRLRRDARPTQAVSLASLRDDALRPALEELIDEGHSVQLRKELSPERAVYRCSIEGPRCSVTASAPTPEAAVQVALEESEPPSS